MKIKQQEVQLKEQLKRANEARKKAEEKARMLEEALGEHQRRIDALNLEPGYNIGPFAWVRFFTPISYCLLVAPSNYNFLKD